MKNTVVKSLFNQYLKQQPWAANWQCKGHLIYEEIKAGLLKGFCFKSSAYEADQFELCVFVVPLYVPTDFLGLSYGHSIPSPLRRQWWGFDPDRLDQAASELAPAMSKAQKDFLSKINDAEDFYDYYRKDRKKEIHFYEAVSYSAAYAGLKEADKVLERCLAFMKKNSDIQFDWAQKTYANTERLFQTRGEDRKALLEEWAAHTQKAILKN